MPQNISGAAERPVARRHGGGRRLGVRLRAGRSSNGGAALRAAARRARDRRRCEAAASASSTRWLRGITRGLTRRIASARTPPGRRSARARPRVLAAQRARQRASHASGAAGRRTARAAALRCPPRHRPAAARPSVKSTRSRCSSASQSSASAASAASSLRRARLQAQLGALAAQQVRAIARREARRGPRWPAPPPDRGRRRSAAAASRRAGPGSTARWPAGCRTRSGRRGRSS